MILCVIINLESWLIISVSKFSIHLAEQHLHLDGMLEFHGMSCDFFSLCTAYTE